MKSFYIVLGIGFDYILNEIIPLFAEVLCMDHFDGLFIA